MAGLGDRPASEITTREINELLSTISANPRTKPSGGSESDDDTGDVNASASSVRLRLARSTSTDA